MSVNAGMLAQVAHQQQQAAIQEQVVRMAASRGDIPWRDAEAIARPPGAGAPASVHAPADRRAADEGSAALAAAAEDHDARLRSMAAIRIQQHLIRTRTARPVVPLEDALDGRAWGGCRRRRCPELRRCRGAIGLPASRSHASRRSNGPTYRRASVHRGATFAQPVPDALSAHASVSQFPWRRLEHRARAHPRARHPGPFACRESGAQKA